MITKVFIFWQQRLFLSDSDEDAIDSVNDEKTDNVDDDDINYNHNYDKFVFRNDELWDGDYNHDVDKAGDKEIEL